MNEEFEDFDVNEAPKATDEVTAESLEGVGIEADLPSVLAARDEAERLFMPATEDALSAMAEDGTAGTGNVVGVGIAEKLIGGSPSGQLGVTVFVKEKVSARRVSGEALVPETIGGVVTDVEAIGEIRAQMFTARLRPAPGGVSIGHCGVVHAGTLGCLVTRGGQLFVLSNNHVMGLTNASPLGAKIPQPGRLDGGKCPQDVIASLTQFIPISFNQQVCNSVDAAIAHTAPNLVDRRILRTGGARVPLTAPVLAPSFGLDVIKSGRTTETTVGKIDALNVTVLVNYGNAGVAKFCGQFRVKGVGSSIPFSKAGDSGSLVTKRATNQPVGLLFAGNATNNVTFCNPIREVLNAFGAQIVF